MKKDDFYKEAHLRRHLYWNVFQGVAECDIDGLNGKLEWFGNYVSFLDSMLQISILEETSRHFLLPCKIRKVVIDPITHYQECQNGSKLYKYAIVMTRYALNLDKKFYHFPCNNKPT